MADSSKGLQLRELKDMINDLKKMIKTLQALNPCFSYLISVIFIRCSTIELTEHNAELPYQSGLYLQKNTAYHVHPHKISGSKSMYPVVLSCPYDRPTSITTVFLQAYSYLNTQS